MVLGHQVYICHSIFHSSQQDPLVKKIGESITVTWCVDVILLLIKIIGKIISTHIISGDFEKIYLLGIIICFVLL